MPDVQDFITRRRTVVKAAAWTTPGSSEPRSFQPSTSAIRHRYGPGIFIRFMGPQCIRVGYLTESVWPPDLPFPPPPDTLLHVRIHLATRRVVWIERIWNAGNDSHAAQAVPSTATARQASTRAIQGRTSAHANTQPTAAATPPRYVPPHRRALTTSRAADPQRHK